MFFSLQHCESVQIHDMENDSSAMFGSTTDSGAVNDFMRTVDGMCSFGPLSANGFKYGLLWLLESQEIVQNPHKDRRNSVERKVLRPNF